MMKRSTLYLLATTLTVSAAGAQSSTAIGTSAVQPSTFTHADSLRGGNGPGRSWWDLQYYDLRVKIEPKDSTISGSNAITYKVLKSSQSMQIDLQQPLVIDSIVQDGRKVTHRRDGNAFFVTLTASQRVGSSKTVTVFYHGKPVAAKNPPWDGGLIWRTDSIGNAWISTANQGIGASVWWPNKDHYADEPDSQFVAITVPAGMTNISNGRLRGRTRGVTAKGDSTWTWNWFVNEPINNYAISINAGAYDHFFSVYQGEAGTLSLDYWPLKIHGDEAAHEWWANSLTMNDAAYMWIHESFANYSENLFVECQTNDKKAGAEYVIGTRRLINNRTPIEGRPGVDDEGNGNDMYYKGGNVLHTIRQIVNDDAKWKGMLRGLQSTFRHQTISGAQVEAYMEKESGVPLKKVFDQYLRSTKIPELEYRLDNGKLAYRWVNTVAGFDMPVAVTAGGATVVLKPTTAWKSDGPALASLEGFAVDTGYYVTAKAVP
jgi:aminopeptidase N